MSKYYIYDVDGCGYASSICITEKPLKCYRDFIGEAETPYKANLMASKYVYRVQEYIDVHSDREYYTDIDEDGVEHLNYPEFDEDKDYIDFISEDDF